MKIKIKRGRDVNEFLWFLVCDLAALATVLLIIIPAAAWLAVEAILYSIGKFTPDDNIYASAAVIVFVAANIYLRRRYKWWAKIEAVKKIRKGFPPTY